MPILRSSAPVETPGQLASTMKAEGRSLPRRAKTMKTSAKPALEIHCFVPFKM